METLGRELLRHPDGAGEDDFSALESRSIERREGDLMAALVRQITHAKANTAWFRTALNEVDPPAVRTREDLARLPLLRKRDLPELQRANPPFGGMLATAIEDLARIYCSAGPVNVPEAHGRDWWRAARALHAAGFERGDIVVNTFSYHFTPAAALMESGARELGCVVLPTGVGQTEAQARLIASLRATGYVGTPSFLKQIVECALGLDLDILSLRKALVTGEYLAESFRQWALTQGIEIFQCYAVADIGLIAYEERSSDGTVAPGMVVDESILLEIVRPGTGDPMPVGEVGEVVVSTFNIDYPLIRFATGDLSSLVPGGRLSHRTNERISGWRGRADQSTKVRGLFIHPTHVAEIVRRHAEVERARFEVRATDEGDDLQLVCEVSGSNSQLIQSLVETVRAVTQLRCRVTLASSGDLPNDGVVISDQRKYD